MLSPGLWSQELEAKMLGESLVLVPLVGCLLALFFWGVLI